MTIIDDLLLWPWNPRWPGLNVIQGHVQSVNDIFEIFTFNLSKIDYLQTLIAWYRSHFYTGPFSYFASVNYASIQTTGILPLICILWYWYYGYLNISYVIWKLIKLCNFLSQSYCIWSYQNYVRIELSGTLFANVSDKNLSFEDVICKSY